MLRHFVLSLSMLALCHARAAPGADERIWAQLRAGGNIILMRHAQTDPGIGDPPQFRLGDCSTQRNLSAQGRSDAAALGEQFRRRAIPVDAVLSSRWCRCLDTAAIAFGRLEPEPALDSTFNDGSGERRRAQVLALLAAREVKGNLVLVTHQVNITALTGVVPAPGELVITRLDRAGKLARVLPAD